MDLVLSLVLPISYLIDMKAINVEQIRSAIVREMSGNALHNIIH